MYNIIIIGCGVNGAFIARYLSQYSLNVLVIEKNSDVGDETSCANSAIIHSGYDPLPTTLKAKLNVKGNQMYDKVCEELDVEFDRIGSLTIATNPHEINELEKLINRAKENKVEVRLIKKEELFNIEHNVNKDALMALYAPSAGIINPFELVIALMENAVDNGVELRLNEEVVDIKRNDNGFEVITNKGKYYTKVVVNAAGLYADKINNLVNEEKFELIPRKGEYFVLDHFKPEFVKHVLFSIPTDKGKGVLITPTTSNNYLIGPSSEFVEEKDDLSTNKEVLDKVLVQAKKLANHISTNKIIR